MNPSLFQRMLCIALLLLMSGCASIAPTVNPTQSRIYAPQIADILSGEALLGHKVLDSELPNVDLLAITPEMDAFAKNAIRRSESNFDKIKNLHIALLSASESGGRGITYSAYITESPIQTFEQRRANCLSFTLLYVAMARAVGIDARVNNVEVPPTWDMRNKKDMFFLRHVNAKVSVRGEGINIISHDDVIIDLEMDRYKPNYRQYEISDSLAAAQFYSNRAIEYLENNNFLDSFLNLRKSISLNDQQSYVWSNLGALYGRKKMWDQAEVAYLHGLSLNPDDLTIMNNLGSFYTRIGDKEKALTFIQRAQRYRDSNPFYQYNLALSAVDQGEYQEALKYILRAIERDKKELRFYQLALTIYEKRGNNYQASNMRNKIKKLTAQ